MSSPPHTLFALATSSETELERQAAAFAVLASRQDERSFHDSITKTCSQLTDGIHRLACVTSGPDSLAALLEGARSGYKHPNLFRGKVRTNRKLMWIFPGHTARGARACRGLFDHEAAFRERMNECDAEICDQLGWSLVDRLNDQTFTPETVDAVSYQLATFAIQASLAALWRCWGVEPDGVLGHSMGELAAAYVAETITLKDAVALTAKRSALLEGLRGLGGMAAIKLSAEELADKLTEFEGKLFIAAVNSRRATVVSGNTHALNVLIASLKAGGVRCNWLADAPAHSPLTEPAAVELEQFARGFQPSAGRVAFYSTVAAEPRPGVQLDAAYWRKNLCQSVRFAPAILRAFNDGFTDFLELSALPILSPDIEEEARSCGNSDIAVIPSLRRDKDERLTMLQAAAQLFIAGQRLNWLELLNGGASGEHVS